MGERQRPHWEWIACVVAKDPREALFVFCLVSPQLAIKEWIPDDEPDLDWFNRPRNPSNPDPEGLDQSQTWLAPEIHLDDGRILVLESTKKIVPDSPKNRRRKKSWQSGLES